MQMEDQHETVHVTALAVHGRHYHFNVLPFGAETDRAIPAVNVRCTQPTYGHRSAQFCRQPGNIRKRRRRNVPAVEQYIQPPRASELDSHSEESKNFPQGSRLSWFPGERERRPALLQKHTKRCGYYQAYSNSTRSVYRLSILMAPIAELLEGRSSLAGKKPQARQPQFPHEQPIASS